MLTSSTIAKILRLTVVSVMFAAMWLVAPATNAHALAYLDQAGCSLRGRTWSNGSCTRVCMKGTGTLVVATNYDYCSLTESRLSQSTCASLGRKWLLDGCARRADQLTTANAPQCAVSGNTYKVSSPYDYCASPAPAVGWTRLGSLNSRGVSHTVDACKVVSSSSSRGVLYKVKAKVTITGLTSGFSPYDDYASAHLYNSPATGFYVNDNGSRALISGGRAYYVTSSVSFSPSGTGYINLGLYRSATGPASSGTTPATFTVSAMKVCA